MKKDEIDKKYIEIISKGKEETEKWIISLSEEDFKILVSLPITVQAKIHYKKIRQDNKRRSIKII